MIMAMAALSEPRPAPSGPRLVELREVQPADLEPLLREEAAEWLQELGWDIEPSANLVRRFLGMRALSGYALPDRGARAAGYVYYVTDEGKGLVGGLFVSRKKRTIEHENALLAAALDALWRSPGLRRVEAQLMLLESPLARPVPFGASFRAYERHFLEASLADIVALPPRDPAVVVTTWAENRRADAARLIAEAYQGHIDSQINDQYRSPGGARRFLTNIVEYPGCGAFFPPASFVALAGPGQGLAGMCLASIVAPGAGHITQVCVAQPFRGFGLGYELLRRSLVSLAAHACGKVSLTVTAANYPAAALYRRMGFSKRRDFAAYVWER
jgi:ribosomal protein S18 acetylase RimI-like enzyme